MENCRRPARCAKGRTLILIISHLCGLVLELKTSFMVQSKMFGFIRELWVLRNLQN